VPFIEYPQIRLRESGLSPWEIATRIGAVHSEGYLIKPPAEWQIQDRWDEAAEAENWLALMFENAGLDPAFTLR
jgi:hypothetical protein